MPPPTVAARAPRLLALDTATERMAVAVVDGERVWGGEEAGAARASQRLLPRVFEGLDRAALRLTDLDAIAFSGGPGAFTGLRTACSVAQGLALGAGLPVLRLDSLALVAEDAWAQHGAAAQRLWVAQDARMDEVYAAAYEYQYSQTGHPAGHGGHWRALCAPALWSLAALAQVWREAPPACVAGSALTAFGARLPCTATLRVDTVQDRVAALARLARAAWQRGEAVDAALALPLYLRDRVALTTDERAARQAAEGVV